MEKRPHSQAMDKNKQNTRSTQARSSQEAKIQAARAKRNQKLDFDRMKHSVRKRVSGKPSRPRNDVTIPGVFAKFTGKIALVFIVLLLALALVAGGTGLGILSGYINTTEEIPNSLFTIREQTSHMYDKDGELMATMTGASNINREVISYGEVSNTYIDDAFMAIEDRTFEKNIGIDPRRIISAVINTLIGSDESHGGSTITQQTIKMISGDNEVSFQRKVQEWYRAVRLTEQLSKSEIMQLYLNYVPMGNSFVGIESAAKAYFGKPASQLNLAESALLAGIPKSPSSYNLRTELGRKNAQRRQRIVLQAMLEEGMINVQQFEDALNYEIVYRHDQVENQSQEVYSYFEEFVMNEVTRDLMDQYGYSYSVANSMVMNGGLEIHTAHDTKIQDVIDEMSLDITRFQKDPSLYVNSPEVPQGAAIIYDNANTTVVAMMGGYGEKEANMVFNRATDARKSPASSVKPMAIVAPAIEEELITGATIVRDQEVFMDYQHPDEAWPLNFYRGYYLGDMTVRDFVKISNNVAAVKILNSLGIETSKSYLSQMGIDMSNQDVGLALATGSFTYNPTPMQWGNTFLTLVNGGQYAKAKGYTRVLDAYGTVILEHKPEFNRVFSPETAFMTTKIMEDVMLEETGGTRHLGTGRRAGPIYNGEGELIATSGKTGTNGFDEGSYLDIWTIIQSPYYTAVGWYGFDNRIKQSFFTDVDYTNMQYLIGDLMQEVHKDLEPKDWVQPAGIIELEICTLSGNLATPGCGRYRRKEYFKASSPLTPTEECGIHSSADTPVNRLPSDREFFETGKGYGYGGVI